MNQSFIPYRNNAVTNTKILIKQGTTDFFGWIINNPNAAEAFLQCFDAASIADVTLGTTVPDISIKILTSSREIIFPSNTNVGPTFQKGLVIAATTTDGGAGGLGSALNLVIYYK